MSYTLVTGGAIRLGAKICQNLAKSGHNILVHYRTSEKHAKEVVKMCRGCGVSSEIIFGDFSTLENTRKFIQDVKIHFPDIKNLINNVGNIQLNPTMDEYLALFQVNFFTPVALIDAFLPSIKKSRGSIVNIGVTGLSRAFVKYTQYYTSKQALWYHTKAYAKKLANDFVRVNMVSPGELENSVVKTDLPMNRPGSLEEVVSVIDFLLKDESQYITGQNIEVAGGLGL